MAQSVGKTECDICETVRGIEYCNECAQKFCINCKMYHVRIKASEHHECIPINGATEASLQDELKQRKCMEHNSDFISCCEQCDVLTCQTCMFTTHNMHKMAELEKACASKIKKTTENMSIYRQKEKKIEEEIARMTKPDYKDKLSSETASVIDKIEKTRDKLKKEIDEKSSDLIKQMREAEKVTFDKIAKHLKMLKECQENMAEAIKESEHLIKRKPSTPLLHQLIEVQKKLQEEIPKKLVLPVVRYTESDRVPRMVKEMVGSISIADLSICEEESVQTEDTSTRVHLFQCRRHCGTNVLLSDYGEDVLCKNCVNVNGQHVSLYRSRSLNIYLPDGIEFK